MDWREVTCTLLDEHFEAISGFFSCGFLLFLAWDLLRWNPGRPPRPSRERWIDPHA
jgi:hypothetical protein